MIRDNLETARKQLLDLSGRNRLLNHKTTGHRTLAIIDELPDEVFRILIEESRPMQFLAIEESSLLNQDDPAHPPPHAGPDRAAADDDPADPSAADLTQRLFELAALDAAPAADRHADLFLQTPLPGPKLQHRLLNLSRVAESALQEQGANVLYLAIGTVQWRESSDSTESRRAPLLLVPVELTRANVNSRHKVRRFDEDIQVNPALRELCAQIFKADLPDFDPDAQPLHPPTTPDAPPPPGPIDRYLDLVRTRLTDPLGWSLLPEINIAIFSFAKLLMYLDLDDRRWPPDAPISENHTLARLFATLPPDDAPAPDLPPETLDRTIHPRDTFHVLDADSSQFCAIEAAKSGRNLLISGPPGTGKSQTIANIIAELLAESKAVLFVAEKAAALDVVKERLDDVGIGDFVADLHSRKTSKRDFAASLARSLDADFPAPSDDTLLTADDLQRDRAAINDYVDALHRRRPPLDISPFDAIGRCAALADAPTAPIHIPEFDRWSRDTLHTAQEAVAAYARTLAHVGDRAAHPWRGIDAEDLPLTTRQSLPIWLGSLATTLDETRAAADDLASRLSIPRPPSVDALHTLIAALRAALHLPESLRGAVASPEWDRTPPHAAAILDRAKRLAELRARLADRWIPEAESVDLSDLPTRLRLNASSITRLLRPSWWRDRKLIRAHARPGTRPLRDIDTLLADLADLTEARRLRDQIRDASLQGAALFADLWNDDDTDWAAAESAADALVRIRRAIRDNDLAPETLLELLDTDRPALDAALTRLERDLARLADQWRALAEPTRADETEFFDARLAGAPLEDVRRRIDHAAASVESVTEWTALNRARRACRDAAGPDVAAWAESHTHESLDPDDLLPAFLLQFHRLWLDRVLRDDPLLRDFRADDHQALIQRFRALDRRWIELSRRRAAARIAERRPRSRTTFAASSGLSILIAEAGKKRRHMPIRRLLAGPAGAVAQSLKPCFMMSPLSVAQFLDPASLRFDTVIFDEASQVLPEDALGAIARARQVILVGDENQLPPTNFFQTIGAVDADTPEPEESRGIDAADLESILSLGKAAYPSSHVDLRWHYRSRHESLIEFSNHQFYNDRLRIFPSPSRDRARAGLRFHLVHDAVYRRGTARDNPAEARAVADAVLEHAQSQPDRSLGVGAFSSAQQLAIQDEIESLRRDNTDTAVERFFSPDRHEPFFVKNLETIQGDERDVILLSVGYGRDENDRLTMNFGPINQDGGWRRLNVLVTRARERCVLFSSIVADDIPLRPNMPRGLAALKAYLHFAQHALMPDIDTRQRDHDSEFEAAVARALIDRGLDVHPQVGCAGFSIDLAVVHPRNHARYAVGIECDGAAYHSTPTARDRDRIRQAVLESRGWTILRLWSTDWFNNPAQSLDRLLHQITHAIEAQAAPEAPPEPTPTPQPPTPPPTPGDDPPGPEHTDPERSKTGDDAPPYAEMKPYRRFRSRPLGDRDALVAAPARRLADLIARVVDVESPIHTDELFAVITRLYATRTVGEAEQRLREALRHASTTGLVRVIDSFVWAADDRPLVPRWRRPDDAVTRAEHIAPEEVAEVARLVALHEFAVPRAELPAAAIRAMGFARVGANLAALAEHAVHHAIDTGLVTLADNDTLTAPAEPPPTHHH